MEEFKILPIGMIRSPYKSLNEAPRQGRFSEDVCVLEIFEEYEKGLTMIENCKYIIVLYWLHLADRTKLTAVPPHEGVEKGVFATRSQNRPNPIGLSVVKLLRRNGRFLEVIWIDAIDGTPVLDIKPYSKELDCVE
ncbi:MAG: tRNA (N6-threonylcarbamoyladenosine(37)-N6)-methyltransferase TrmO [Archaeoglobaceae archaeon]|nr:tRNA (N6-threonylcarbamoyladenosine(37)-N6)-methyltransferase TrmO [Archaeoglobaceae archaeon]MCX8151945.1 tRNA (N6-threonylcarbamoyladenosine(37)-N6)-methyltransferase TrmO [Archaeoglobaceae archaeon]MDW8013334.1 tRNA (N6-threonylcarbamoyladenosine(37)-N6)-methyltransferase TrmO [Archaeoglobaceae archaeon]